MCRDERARQNRARTSALFSLHPRTSLMLTRAHCASSEQWLKLMLHRCRLLKQMWEALGHWLPRGQSVTGLDLSLRSSGLSWLNDEAAGIVCMP